MFTPLFSLSLILGSASAAAKYEQYILTPSSRTIHPSSVYNINGTVDNAESLTSSSPGNALFHDASAVTYDFGKNIGGVVKLTIGSVSDANQFIGVTYSESSLWISGEWSDATSDTNDDAPLWFQPTAPGDYTVDLKYQRGGFKYLSLVHNTTGTLEVQKLQINYTAIPHIPEDEMRNYSGWFNSDDELINRIWYAGAYTAQLCTIDPHYGSSLNYFGIDPPPGVPLEWWSNSTIANSSSVLTDGPKRDRLIWPGDMVTSWPSMAVSTDDKVTVKNSLDVLFDQQQKNGELPYAGLPFPYMFSATYHLHSLIGVAEIYFYGGDLDYVAAKWDAWKYALNYSLGDVDETDLLNVTSPRDWLRFGMGGHNIEANAILYETLHYGIILAKALNDPSVIPTYENYSTNIKTAANALLWDASANLYRDNETTTLHPQDGNSWAILSNLTDSTEKAANISNALISRRGPYGAPAPEAGTTVSPFVGYFELQAHAAAKNATAILDLCRLQWGFMLDDPRMTNSTFIEGYSTDGRLHYAPYQWDSRISHAHGWSTGPTSVLTFNVAGVQIVETGGQVWKIAPRLGDLTRTDAGYKTDLGTFSAKTTMDGNGGVSIEFEAPKGTKGSVSLEYPKCNGVAVLKETTGACGDQTFEIQGSDDPEGDIVIEGLVGGSWQLKFSCT